MLLRNPRTAQSPTMPTVGSWPLTVNSSLNQAAGLLDLLLGTCKQNLAKCIENTTREMAEAAPSLVLTMQL